MHRREAIFVLKRLLIASGDRRMACLAELLEQDGYQVEHWNGEGHMEKLDAVLLAYPFSAGKGVKPVPKEVCGDALVIAGRGVDAQDYPNLKRYTDAEELEKRNAELSAEAALFEAMLHSPVALMDARVLVTGYGLFGRALALRMRALGAQVWVAARRKAQREEAVREGMRAVSILEMEELLPEMDLVLNTIPARIFSEYHLKYISKKCWLLELASAPYGLDAQLCKEMGLNCVVLPGLPGKYSPMSAASALRDAVRELLEGGKV